MRGSSVNERRIAMGERNERVNESEVTGEEPKTAEYVFRSESKTKPIYFSCAARPRDLKKSEITLHNLKDHNRSQSS
jgi:Tat protein secretion system quality control protein TatD with DNase activity